jgi:mono/diheme cytochrome c family protein
MSPLTTPGLRRSLALVLVAGLAGCRHEAPRKADDPSDPQPGIELFEAPLPDGNSFACATCHALAEPASDGLRRPGHPIGDATRRRSWKNGKAPTFLAAVNSCLEEWMGAPAWTGSDPRFLALRDYLDRQASASRAPDLRFEIVQPPADVSGGDAARGRTVFDQTCVVCHGAGGVGTDRGPRVIHSNRLPDYISKRIRTSGSAKSAVYGELTGGVMPFWAKDRLDDGEVRDLVAFLRDAPADAAVTPPDPVADAAATPADGPLDAGTPLDGAVASRDGAPVPPDAGPPTSGCPRTHPRVGWKADLGVNTGEGEVSGFVTMIDDCTLELTSFSYNGDGIEVRLFGSKASNFRPGFTIGPDMVGRRFVKATMKVKLPTGKTLDDLDWVSVWCVKARADFGSGPFRAP